MASNLSPFDQYIQSRISGGPQFMEDQRSAIETAQQKSQSSIDQLRGIYSDPSNVEVSPWGAMGLGLMKGTKSGSFNEGMYNGLSAAMAAQTYNKEQNLSRMEKLAKLSELEGMLSRQKATDERTLYDTGTGYITQSANDQGILADQQLNDMQLGSRPLEVGEQGPVAPDQSPEAQAELVYQDYMRNPQKYAGAQGQAMVRNAVDTLNNVRNVNARMQIAQTRAQQQGRGRGLTTVDKKIINDAKGDNATLKYNLEMLQRAEKLGPDTWYGPMADTRARVSSWWNGDEGAADSTADEHIEYQQIMQGEAIKQMSEQLKGATTDREMQKFIDMVADPSLPWSVKKHAVKRVMGFIESQIAINDERIQGVADQSYYTGVPADGAPLDVGQNGYDVGDDDLSGLTDGTVIEDTDGTRYVIQGGEKVRIEDQ